jgi:hypothetical protein
MAEATCELRAPVDPGTGCSVRAVRPLVTRGLGQSSLWAVLWDKHGWQFVGRSCFEQTVFRS